MLLATKQTKQKRGKSKKEREEEEDRRNIQILFGFYGTSLNAVRWRDQMASPNRIKASSAKELALPTSLALVSHVLSDAKQTRAGRKSSPPYPPFCRRANTSVFRFESTQRARTRPASLSPQSRRDFSPLFLFSFFTTAQSTPNEEEEKKKIPGS